MRAHEFINHSHIESLKESSGTSNHIENLSVYFDMDGVLADFTSSALELIKTKEFINWHRTNFGQNDKHMRNRIGTYLATLSDDQIGNFFVNLKPLSLGINLAQWTKQNNIKIGIITVSIGKTVSAKNTCQNAKKAWLQKYVGPIDYFIDTRQKYKYSKNGPMSRSVLIDDRRAYLNDWDNSGGIGILWPSPENNLNGGIPTMQDVQNAKNTIILTAKTWGSKEDIARQTSLLQKSQLHNDREVTQKQLDMIFRYCEYYYKNEEENFDKIGNRGLWASAWNAGKYRASYERLDLNWRKPSRVGSDNIALGGEGYDDYNIPLQIVQHYLSRAGVPDDVAQKAITTVLQNTQQ